MDFQTLGRRSITITTECPICETNISETVNIPEIDGEEIKDVSEVAILNCPKCEKEYLMDITFYIDIGILKTNDIDENNVTLTFEDY